MEMAMDDLTYTLPGLLTINQAKSFSITGLSPLVLCETEKKKT